MKKIFYFIQLKNVSPLCIGNGIEEITDMDVLLDHEGKFFIPGTSIAGACLDFLDEDEKEIMNPEFIDSKNRKHNKLSQIFISDATLDENSTTTIEVRDGIGLNYDTKITDSTAKYDYQIIPEGKVFVLRIEINDLNGNIKQLENIVNKLLSNIHYKNIRFGFKKGRGLGCFKIEGNVRKRIFDDRNYEQMFTFDKFNEKQYDEIETLSEPGEDKYVNIHLKLQQNGGISIRTYYAKKDFPDYIHIMSNGKPVIPGTSWAGFFRSNFYKYEKYLNQEGVETNNLTENLFGTLGTVSKIRFSESTIKDYEKIVQSRVKIDRFYSGSVNKGLFKEQSIYNGNTKLDINIKKDDSLDMELVMNILDCIFQDMNDGLVAIGGLASIGRGLFTVEKVEEA